MVLKPLKTASEKACENIQKNHCKIMAKGSEQLPKIGPTTYQKNMSESHAEIIRKIIGKLTFCKC
jgi:hypothetical protein